MDNRPRYINVKGKLLDLDTPRVMGILNITPDSFYPGSRYNEEKSFIAAAAKMIEEGADILDIGGFSSRPGAVNVSEEEERGRVIKSVRLLLKELPDSVVSVDTFRSGIAREAVLDCGAAMINDISGGTADPEMFRVVRELNVPYVLMHMQGTPATMQQNPVYDDVVADILRWFGRRIYDLHASGVKDIIIDPGFGFGKTTEHNFELLRRLGEFLVTGLPLLAGLSRKTTVWKTLGVGVGDALNGTTVLNTVALLNGADMLRVHDVREAAEAVRLVKKLKQVTS